MTYHPQNRNLTLHANPYYQGLPVQTARGPLIENYLVRAKQVIEKSLEQHGRVFAFRLDLRFPSGQHQPYADSNLVLERFISSFKAKINHNRSKALAANRHAHDTSVRYVWCRELGGHGVPHYHMAILLNNDAYCTLGCFEMGRKNLYNRLHEAWASALGIAVDDAMGLVEFPENPFYLLQRSNPKAIDDFFHRISYLCKADTKHYGDRVHGFGASRV